MQFQLPVLLIIQSLLLVGYGTSQSPPASFTSENCVSSKVYKVKTGDTATSISTAQNVSTRAIININGLSPDGSDLAAGGSICLPVQCPIYLVPTGSSCAKIAQQADINLSNFKQFNLDIDGGCTNLIAGYNVCIGELKWFN